MREVMKAEAVDWEVAGPLTEEDMAGLTTEADAEWRAFERGQEKPTGGGNGPLVKMFAEQLTRKQQASAVPAKTEDTASEFSRVRNPSGISPSLKNAMKGIQQLGIVFRYDKFRQRVTFEGADRHLGVTMDQIVLHVREVIIERFEFDPEAQHTRDAIQILAMQNSFDPVLDYIDAQKWDGVPRIDAWLSVYLGAEDNALNRAFGRAVLIAGVRRARRPGSKWDYVLVLEGAQGLGKSSALKIMAGGEEFFSDEIVIGVSYKEQQELLGGRWIVELPELAGLRNADIRGVKQFVSKQFDRGRPAFGRSVENLPRKCIFIGTTNDSQYLRDATGNRRFWPVVVGKIDLKGLAEDMLQLWAEAAEAEPDAPDPLTIPEGLWTVAAERQAERVAGDPWEDLLMGGLESMAQIGAGEMRISTQTIFERVLKLDLGNARNSSSQRLADCMRRLRWEGPKLIRFDTGPARGYWKTIGDE
ncbi:virulence-associated E family protein [Mesorhizobium ciceri]|uniref:Virulence-associated E family protein n=1 Tax=Mesorhizobium ciceri biovar biserrulae (strain HAMBI 2942 / LMG 23838 / WSM1271) TaxID=765698 RepID=E8T7W4_MESCW|nr:virulence-associated E family protein [Mesorhizobium ciceri]ADV12965.1 virulence-associated E family protein [Mesorhizobium ciceri biovar biserrulae WSM1271]